ncbi:hypothetical protein [Amycolatopsis alba]|nr:hypothetical protein [Amycolatopsis alba]
MDPTEISTLSELAGALEQLRRERSLSLRGLADAAAKLPKQEERQPALPKATASDLLNARSVPEAETVVTFLAACGIHEKQALRPWLQALERVATQHQRRPPGTVRVRDSRPRMLGVHAAIQTTQLPECAQSGQSGQGESALPLYVPRDFDAGLRTKLTLARQQGGFVLLSGDSSVGKTRALFEAVQAVLPDWWLLHPCDAEALREFTAHPSGRTVVWLDELQDYLDFAGGVPAGRVRELIAAGLVLVATCWPGEHSKRVALPEEGRPDRYANDRRLLRLADVLHVPPTFSVHERRRAEDLAGTDRRIRLALDTPDAGFTQVMAAGPELIRHWEQAPAYAKAVITAALDARRVGAHAPLTCGYLEAAAPGYLTGQQQATAPPTWLDEALRYASEQLHGATSALIHAPGGMGQVIGYRVADYLHQHALRVRRFEYLPDAAWHALIDHHHPDDTQRIAENADARGCGHEAVILYRQLADNGGRKEGSTVSLAHLLAEHGYEEELRTRADNGDRAAALRLAHLLAEHGHEEELLTRANNSDQYASISLAGLLVEQGRVEAALPLLRTWADDDYRASIKLAELLVECGREEELRTRADNGNWYASIQLAELLAGRGHEEELRSRAERGDRAAAHRLAGLLAEQGRIETAIPLLRPYADDGDWYAASRLAELLAKRGHEEELRTRAGNGNWYAANHLVQLLVEEGRVEAAILLLSSRADRGDRYAASRLAELLAEHGHGEELRARADNGDQTAALRLADLLAEHGHGEELRARADNGDEHAVSRLAKLLAVHGHEEELRTRADNGDEYAAFWLAELLAIRGREEAAIPLLRTHAYSGDPRAANLLIQLLAKRKLLKELEREVTAGTPGAVDALRHVRRYASNEQVADDSSS